MKPAKQSILNLISPLELLDTSMIHTTVGVYNNGDMVVNGVSAEDLVSHIEYNKTMRFGRALFVDGVIHNVGYLGEERCKALIPEILELKTDKASTIYR